MQDAEDGFGDFGTNAVTGDERDGVSHRAATWTAIILLTSLPVAEDQAAEDADAEECRRYRMQPAELRASGIRWRQRSDRHTQNITTTGDRRIDERTGHDARRDHRSDDEQASAEADGTRSNHLHADERREQHGRRAVADDVETAKHFAHHVRSPRPSGVAVRPFECGKGRWSDHARDRNHAAEPHDERDDIRITQRGHPGIIVRFTLPSPFTPAVPAPGDGGTPASRSIAWLEWNADAFSRARAEARPVLLSITASWCHGCAVMDRVAYADPAVIDIVTSRFVPVRIDADRRPDVNERYNLDGWPTTALLTPSGEMLTGTTYLPAAGLRAMLEEVSDAYRTRHEELDARATQMAAARRARRTPSTGRVEPDLSASQWIARRAVDECDALHGGFGTDGKFLHVAALRVALDEYLRTGDRAIRDTVTQALDAMADGQIHDAVEGGFFRYAAGRDWARPHTEKMLDDQAGLVELYADAGRALESERYRRIARETMAYVHRTLRNAEPAGFFASQAADESYYQLTSADIRRTLSAPVVDRTEFTDLTARAAVAWLRAGVALEDRAAAEFGARALDRLVTLTYEPGNGVAHWFDGRPGIRGLLTDQVHAAWALVALHEASAQSDLVDARRRADADGHAHALGRRRTRFF